MKHVLVPVLSTSDISAIPETIKFLRLLSPASIVVVNNPSVGITSESATAAIDKQIADLEKAESEAAARRDYPGAQQFHEQTEDARMQRTDILRDGWKSVPQEDRNAVYDKLFMDSFQGFNFTQNITLPEDSTPEDLLSVLANLGTAWPDCLPHSEWSLVFPRSVTPITMPTQAPDSLRDWKKVSDTVVAQKAPESAPVANAPTPREAREKQLRQFFSLKKAAAQHGISMEGRSTKDVIEEVLAKEFAA